MSNIFFADMDIPKPFRKLEGGNGSHGEMTGYMLIEIEKAILEIVPDYLLVYGDTNSTLAGALAASKLHIPVIHVEAGLRSYNKAMPEEINRIITDHISSILCCPTRYAVACLVKEGIQDGVHHVGDVMFDAALLFGEKAEQTSAILSTLQLTSKSFYLCTFHRAENTESFERLEQISKAITIIAGSNCPVVLPLHPRTKKQLQYFGLNNSLESHPHIYLTEPIGFLDMVKLEKHAALILTDSGGIQKEAYFHQTPCVTLREETEWIETVEAGWNQLAGYKTTDILDCVHSSFKRQTIEDYGNGNAAEKILGLI